MTLAVVVPELWFVRLVLQRGLPQGGLVVGDRLQFLFCFSLTLTVLSRCILIAYPSRLPPFFPYLITNVWMLMC